MADPFDSLGLGYNANTIKSTNVVVSNNAFGDLDAFAGLGITKPSQNFPQNVAQLKGESLNDITVKRKSIVNAADGSQNPSSSISPSDLDIFGAPPLMSSHVVDTAIGFDDFTNTVPITASTSFADPFDVSPPSFPPPPPLDSGYNPFDDTISTPPAIQAADLSAFEFGASGATSDPFGITTPDVFGAGSDPFGMTDDPFLVKSDFREEDPFALPSQKPLTLTNPTNPTSSVATTNHVDVEVEEDPAAAMARLRAMYNLGPEDAEENKDDDDSDIDDNDETTGTGTGHPADTNNSHSMSSLPGGGTTMSLPSPSPLVFEGDILARISSRTLFTKEWDPMYWVLEDNTLLLYRNKHDFYQNPRGALVKKKILLKHNHRCVKIKQKEYKGMGQVYNFMLEEVQDYGAVNAGKFASESYGPLEALWLALKTRILTLRGQ
eukprot:gene12704-26760_t